MIKVSCQEQREESLWACFRGFVEDSENSLRELMLALGLADETAALAAVVTTVAEDTLESFARSVSQARTAGERVAAHRDYLERHAEYLVEQRRFWSAVVRQPRGLEVLLSDYAQRLFLLLWDLYDPATGQQGSVLRGSFGIPRELPQFPAGTPR